MINIIAEMLIERFDRLNQAANTNTGSRICISSHFSVRLSSDMI